MIKIAPTIAMILVLGCASSIPVQKDEAFTFAVEAVQDEKYVAGAQAAWNYLDTADPDDPRYDRGLRLMARSAEGLGLTWAASMIYRQIAHARRNMELVPDAIAGIERIVQSGLYDEDILITSFIASQQFGDLPQELQAFVNYQQGADLARRMAHDWSEELFVKLPADSLYAHKAQYVRVVSLVADGNFQMAIEMLEELRTKEKLSQKLKQDVERTLARLAFEEQRYGDAIVHFETLKELAPDDPEILLEMAWTYFYLGDSRKTLGLLVALDAPVHKKYIAPERFLLEALSLRRLCQFGAARDAAVRLERKHGQSLSALGSGVLPAQIDAMYTAARYRGQSRKNAKFVDRLDWETQMLRSFDGDLGEGLSAYLLDLYSRGKEEASHREAELIEDDLFELTEELLAAREGVRLIVHELGVSLLRGRRRPAGAKEKPAVDVPYTGEHVFYPFEGEYWTDELDALLVIAEDRCID